MADLHRHLLTIAPSLPTDYAGVIGDGGQVERWADNDKAYPDCSGGCRWALWLEDKGDELISLDWCVCSKPDGPRRGLLTFEHQAGFGCFEHDPEDDDDD